MHRVWTIFRREIGYYFNSIVAYIYIDVFLIVTGILFFATFFEAGQADMRQFSAILPWVFLFFVPAVTMRLWAEERKSGTMEVVMTLPVKDWEVMLGKYLAALMFLLVTLVLSFPIALICFRAAQVPPDAGPIWGGYVGALLMGAAYLAVGIYFSSLTDNQIIALIITIVCLAILLLIEVPVFLNRLPSWLQPFFAFVSLGRHFQSIGRGVIDLRDLIYYASLIFFFLFLTVRSVESRKWR
jgi:ABC-2 type transport system permease protein